MEYEAVIGLEVHVQVKTESKIFSSVGVGFGAQPNSLTDPVVLGFPGVLPVINREAVEKSIKVGMLLNGSIPTSNEMGSKELLLPGQPEELPDLPIRPTHLLRR